MRHRTGDGLEDRGTTGTPNERAVARRRRRRESRNWALTGVPAGLAMV